jgi:DNA-binding XRE family transcriptional regulator
MRLGPPPPLSFSPGGSASAAAAAVSRYSATSPAGTASCRSVGKGSDGNTSSPAQDENDFRKMNLYERATPATDPAASSQSEANTIKSHNVVRTSNSSNGTSNNNSPLNVNTTRNTPTNNNSTAYPTNVNSVGSAVVTGNKTPEQSGSSATNSRTPVGGGLVPASPRHRSFASPSSTTGSRGNRPSASVTNNALMTVTTGSCDVEVSRTAAVTPRRRDDNSLSSSKERKEDDFVGDSYKPSESSAMPPVRSTKPTSEPGRARGATPPRPVGHLRSRSNEVAPVMVMTATTTTATAVASGNSNMPDSSTPSSVQHTIQQRRSSRRSASPNRIPRVPNKQSAAAATDGTSSQNSSPRRFSSSSNNKDQSCHQSLASSGGGSMSRRSAGNSQHWQWAPPKPDRADHEQALFEQRLCEDPYGVAVRKINQNGKPNLRYVKCIFVTESDLDTVGVDSHHQSSTLSNVSSLARSFRKLNSPPSALSNNNENSSSRLRVLTWGKKKEVKLPLDRFVSVRKGKTTDRARRNASPSCRILSLITNHQSLDIEAPTRLDRDKFARAFARFLEVPLVGEDQTAQSVSLQTDYNYKQASTTAMSEPDLATTPKQAILEAKFIKQQKSHNAPLPVVMAGNGNSSRSNSIKDQGMNVPMPRNDDSLRNLGAPGSVNNNSSAVDASSHSRTPNNPMHTNQKVQIASLPSSLRDSERSSTQAATASRPTHPDHEGPVGEDASQVSSLTGAGFDHEIVEELHQALTELRAELEESRAEAARAVKVAEQAIQSAENSNSNDWNSTVTHKAAEAAALAQKKSAEAMSKQRLAEERLEGERRTAAFWRRQAEAAEEEAGALQTRAAAAEVQRAAMVEELECERRKTAAMIQALKGYASSEVGGDSLNPDEALTLSSDALDVRELPPYF